MKKRNHRAPSSDTFWIHLTPWYFECWPMKNIGFFSLTSIFCSLNGNAFSYNVCAGWFVNDIIDFFGCDIIRHHLCGFMRSSRINSFVMLLVLVFEPSLVLGPSQLLAFTLQTMEKLWLLEWLQTISTCKPLNLKLLCCWNGNILWNSSWDSSTPSWFIVAFHALHGYGSSLRSDARVLYSLIVWLREDVFEQLLSTVTCFVIWHVLAHNLTRNLHNVDLLLLFCMFDFQFSSQPFGPMVFDLRLLTYSFSVSSCSLLPLACYLRCGCHQLIFHPGLVDKKKLWNICLDLRWWKKLDGTLPMPWIWPWWHHVWTTVVKCFVVWASSLNNVSASDFHHSTLI